MNKLRIGEIVETLDDVVRGQITQIKGDLITIMTDEGFEMSFSSSELISVKEAGEISVIDEDLKEALRNEANLTQPTSVAQGKNKKKDTSAMEVDLHIEKLVDYPGRMSTHEILEFQLETARKNLQYAMSNRIANLVFIHGVGEGILKSELEKLLKKHANLVYRDASFRKYGLGATEVLITNMK